MTIYEKLTALRKMMQERGIDLYIVENNDPHQSEYMCDYWKEVEWLTGFRGEVATVIVTQSEALLWTDSRFFISGEAQLEGTGFSLMKLKVEGFPTPQAWIAEHKTARLKSAGNRTILFANEVDSDTDLIAEMWTDRPSLPLNKIEVYPEEYDGEKREDRLKRIYDTMPAGSYLSLTALDDIAWTFGLRGTDVMCTPVFMSYAILSKLTDDIQITRLFVDLRKVTPEVQQAMDKAHVAIQEYAEFQDISKGVVSMGLKKANNPVPLMKAIKNPVEIEGYRSAMLKDGIVMTRFYKWLEEELAAGNVIKESTCIQKLIDLRKTQPLYRDESFPAIVGWQEHAAQPHYETTAESDVHIADPDGNPNGFLLIDTGGQYLDGTTDITRTIPIGKISKQQKRDYTLVLKGHIRLATAVFPVGTRGDQVDALARYDLWQHGMTYRHGTCHGVGHYLAVHEGPESVRMEHNPQALMAGMLFSNEPAIYIEQENVIQEPGEQTAGYGIRHENCVLCKPYQNPMNGHGNFLQLETLTLCYIDTTCLDTKIMSQEEILWLNNYNAHVYEMVAPHLTEDEARWLSARTKSILA